MHFMSNTLSPDPVPKDGGSKFLQDIDSSAKVTQCHTTHMTTGLSDTVFAHFHGRFPEIFLLALLIQVSVIRCKLHSSLASGCNYLKLHKSFHQHFFINICLCLSQHKKKYSDSTIVFHNTVTITVVAYYW
jgi:hypothetical protein